MNGTRGPFHHFLFFGTLFSVQAYKWDIFLFFVTLLFLVARKVTRLFESFITLVTTKTLFISVNELMHFQVFFFFENSVTESATIFSTLVFLQMTLLTETPFTLTANMWPHF